MHQIPSLLLPLPRKQMNSWKEAQLPLQSASISFYVTCLCLFLSTLYSGQSGTVSEKEEAEN